MPGCFKCIIENCNTILKTKSSTFSLRYHLINVHNFASNILDFKYESNLNKSSNNKDDKRNLIEKIIARLSSVARLSFNTVATSRDNKLGLRSRNNLNTPETRDTVKKMLYSYGEEVINTIKNDIKDLLARGERFTISSDEFTSIRNQRYLV